MSLTESVEWQSFLTHHVTWRHPHVHRSNVLVKIHAKCSRHTSSLPEGVASRQIRHLSRTIDQKITSYARFLNLLFNYAASNVEDEFQRIILEHILENNETITIMNYFIFRLNAWWKPCFDNITYVSVTVLRGIHWTSRADSGISAPHSGDLGFRWDQIIAQVTLTEDFPYIFRFRKNNSGTLALSTSQFFIAHALVTKHHHLNPYILIFWHFVTE
jgi:hypothetical protein